MNQEQKERIANEILAMLDLTYRKNKDWSEPRVQTAWGSKTKLGLSHSIIHILTKAEVK